MLARRLATFRLRPVRSTKVFCIGLNKTGTTSLEAAIKQLGYRLGSQHSGELLFDAWAQRDFSPIIELAKTADAFQDVPFSLPYTYIALDQAFPDAKFILTVRDSPSQWRNSLIRFHSRLWADGVRVPTEDDLREAAYIYKGRQLKVRRLLYDYPAGRPYDEETLINHYQQHNQNVRDYFRHRPGKLLEINVANPDDYPRLCNFLGKEPVATGFPRLNATS